MKPTQEAEVPEDGEVTSLLRQYRPPAPDPGYIDLAVARARHEAVRRCEHEHTAARARRWGFGAAIAASLAILAVGGLFLYPDAGLLPGANRPEVTLALAEEKTVNLVFSSATPLEDAQLTLLLPPGVELAGFPGRNRVDWTTSLGQGRNLLPLTFVATSRGGGELQATLQHDTRERTYRLRVEIG